MIVFFVGGMGVSILESCIMTEELAYGCTGIQTAMEASSLGVNRNIPIIAIPINEEIFSITDGLLNLALLEPRVQACIRPNKMTFKSIKQMLT